MSRIQQWISMLQSDPVGFVLYLFYLLVTVLLSLILHEVAHGYVAYRCGDATAKWMGRLSLDPRKHLDPIGTICMLLSALAGPNLFRSIRETFATTVGMIFWCPLRVL